MDSKAAKRELKSCEQQLADIREIMVSKEAKLNQIKAKRIQIENNLPSLFSKADLGEIPSEQFEQAKKVLKDLKKQLTMIIENWERSLTCSVFMRKLVLD